MRFPFRQTAAMLLLTHLSTIWCQQFDTVPGCISPGTQIVLTKTLSCPCYLGYSLHSPLDTDTTTDFLLLPTEQYAIWQRNITNPPPVIPQHSTLNASTTSSIFRKPTETAAGSLTFIIRTHTTKTDCDIRLSYFFTQIPRCSNSRGNNIIGGAPSPRLTRHMAILESDSGYCSGTLITNRHILTAAHCNSHTGIARIGNPTSQTYKIQTFTTHPSYRPTPGLPKFDLAIAELSTPTNPTDTQPLRYARGGAIRGAVTIAGYGQTHEGLPDTAFRGLRAAEVRLVGLSSCGGMFSRNGYPGIARLLGRGMLCLGGECADSCYGDSGGGALVEGKHGLVVVGVVSAGIGCGRVGLPGIYTSVAEFEEWVEGVVGRGGVVIGGEVRVGEGERGVGWIGVAVVVGLGFVFAVLEGVRFAWERIGGGFDEEGDDGIGDIVARRWFRSKEFMSVSEVDAFDEE